MSLLNKSVVIYDTYENTYCSGVVTEHGNLFLTIEAIRRNTGNSYNRSYPIKDIEQGEFFVYVKAEL